MTAEVAVIAGRSTLSCHRCPVLPRGGTGSATRRDSRGFEPRRQACLDGKRAFSGEFRNRRNVGDFYALGPSVASARNACGKVFTGMMRRPSGVSPGLAGVLPSRDKEDVHTRLARADRLLLDPPIGRTVPSSTISPVAAILCPWVDVCGRAPRSTSSAKARPAEGPPTSPASIGRGTAAGCRRRFEEDADQRAPRGRVARPCCSPLDERLLSAAHGEADIVADACAEFIARRHRRPSAHACRRRRRSRRPARACRPAACPARCATIDAAGRLRGRSCSRAA